MTDHADPRDLRALSGRVLAVVSPARPAAMAALAAAPDPTRVVELTATARPSAQLLTAPLSGRPCVWYRSVTSPFRERLPTPVGAVRQVQVPRFVPSSLVPPQRASTKRSEPAQIEFSTTPFLLAATAVDGDPADAENAVAIAVDPADVLVDASQVAYNDYRRDADGLATALLQEWIIVPGEKVYAFGAVAGGPSGPQLVAGPAPIAIVGVHDRDELLVYARGLARAPRPRVLVSVIVLPVLLVCVLIALFVFGVL